MKTRKVTGDKANGYRVGIPMQAYRNAGEPKQYECVVLESGQLIYTPVKA